MSQARGVKCDHCGQYCVPGDGRTWITIKDGPIKVTRHVHNARKTNIAYGRFDFCSIGCLVSYINDLQEKMPDATHDVEFIRHRAIFSEPISEPTGDEQDGKA